MKIKQAAADRFGWDWRIEEVEPGIFEIEISVIANGMIVSDLGSTMSRDQLEAISQKITAALAGAARA